MGILLLVFAAFFGTSFFIVLAYHKEFGLRTRGRA